MPCWERSGIEVITLAVGRYVQREKIWYQAYIWQIPIDDSTPAFPLLSRYACMYFRKHWYNQTLICSLTGG